MRPQPRGCAPACPLGETARRLGHSVETLVSTYVGALDDEEQVGNQRIDSILREPVCDFILTASSLGLLARPVISEEILAEARRNIMADRPDLSQERIERRFQNVRVARTATTKRSANYSTTNRS